MSPGDRIRLYADRIGLTQEDVDYLLGVVGEAVLVEREAIARTFELAASGMFFLDGHTETGKWQAAFLVTAAKMARDTTCRVPRHLMET